MKNFIHEGRRATWTNGTGSAVASGSPVIVNGRAFVACVDIADTASGAVASHGVFQFPKETGKTFAQFADVYWDAVAGKVTSDKDLGAATPAAVAGNTGSSGTIASVAVGAAKAGVYHVICIEPGSNAGKFTVEDPDGVTVGVATVAVEFVGGGLTFTITDATDFVAGDAFTITVAAGNTCIGYADLAAASGDTTADVYVSASVKY